MLMHCLEMRLELRRSVVQDWPVERLVTTPNETLGIGPSCFPLRGQADRVCVRSGQFVSGHEMVDQLVLARETGFIVLPGALLDGACEASRLEMASNMAIPVCLALERIVAPHTWTLEL